MGKYRASYERQLLIGTAGTTANTLVDAGISDLDIEKPKTRAETTHRGSGASVPRESNLVVKLSCQITFTMRYKDEDTNTQTLLAAADTGTPVAMVVKRISTGEVEFDGDVTLDQSSPGPLEGVQDIEFTAFPTNELREWNDTTPGPGPGP